MQVLSNRLSRAAVASISMLGCGNHSGSPSPAADTPDARTQSASDRFIPLAVNAKWTYAATDSASGASGTTQAVVEAFEDVGGTKAGIMAYRVRSTTLSGILVDWQQDLGTSIVRQHEEFLDFMGVPNNDYVFNPFRLRLDETPAHTAQGAAWTENNTAVVDSLTAGTVRTATFTVAWTVEAADEVIAVPAGTFHCLRVHRVESGYASTLETDWFARHVGKVKEVNGTVTEVLTSYSLP